MKTLSWNCRGLGSPRAVRALLRLIRLKNPSIVFLMETRLKSDEVQRIKFKCSFDRCLVVECDGSSRDRRGGLALLWKEPINLSILSFSLNHISGKVEDDWDDQPWFFNGIYGFPEEH